MVSQTIISFIVPIYNAEKYLIECIESILKQSISKEIILINDGSTDNSLNIALQYSQKYPFITVISGQNHGQSTARNKGIKIAKGKYIYFIDSDDILLEDLGDICRLADEHNVDIIRVQAKRNMKLNLFEGGPFCLIPSATDNIQSTQGYLFSGYDYFLNIVVKDWIPGICWSIIKRDLLLSNQILFLENVRAEDQLFYVQLLTCKPDIKVLEVGNIIYYYRFRENSTASAPTSQYFVDHFTICQHIQNWKERKNFNHSQIEDAINIVMARNFQTALKLYSTFSAEEQKKHAHYLTKEVIDLINYYLV